MKLKTKICLIAAAVLAVGGTALGFIHWHNSRMQALQEQITQELANRKKLEDRIALIRDNTQELEQQKADLLDQIDALMTKETAFFDAGAVTDEIRSISELSTIEYQYTNVGTLDSSKKFSFIDWNIPFSGKTAIITMDGTIKAGIDFSKVTVNCNEAKKHITVRLPKSDFLSNELDESSFKVFVEKESVWNQISLDDSNSLRKEIKDKAIQNAKDNNVLGQADDRAKQLIRSIIEAIPNVRDQYEISFETLK